MRTDGIKPGKNLIIGKDRSICCVDWCPAANRQEMQFGYFWPHSDKEIQRHLDWYKGSINVIDEREVSA